MPGRLGAQAENNLGPPRGIREDFIWHFAHIAFCYWFPFLFPYSPDMSNLQPKNVSSNCLYSDLHRTFHVVTSSSINVFHWQFSKNAGIFHYN